MRCSSERGDSEPRPDRVSPLPVPPWDSSPLPVPPWDASLLPVPPWDACVALGVTQALTGWKVLMDTTPVQYVIVSYSNRKTAKANIVHFVVAVSQLYFKQISWFLV